MGRGSQSPAHLKQGALLRPASRLLSFSDFFLSLSSPVAFLAPFMVHSCPQLKRLGTGFSFPTGSKELELCRGCLGAEYLSSSAGAETSPLGFGQERGFGLLFGAGGGLYLPVVSRSAASDGTSGLRAVPLGAALSHGFRNRKGGGGVAFHKTKGKLSSSPYHPGQKSCLHVYGTGSWHSCSS